MTKIFIASDHAGYALKANLIEFLRSQNHDPIDLGCDSAEISVNYPDFANQLAMRLCQTSTLQPNSPPLSNPLKSVDSTSNASTTADSKQIHEEFGILICGSGIGISIAANRHRNIRASLCHNEELAKLARAHNNANVLCLGARFTSPELAKKITEIFLKTAFEKGRHEMRTALLAQYGSDLLSSPDSPEV